MYHTKYENHILGTPAPEMAGKSCDSGDCPVKEWFYKGKKQNACSNPDWWSKGPWCPTKKGVDAKGEYISGNYVRCKCGKFVLPTAFFRKN